MFLCNHLRCEATILPSKIVTTNLTSVEEIRGFG